MNSGLAHWWPLPAADLGNGYGACSATLLLGRAQGAELELGFRPSFEPLHRLVGAGRHASKGEGPLPIAQLAQGGEQRSGDDLLQLLEAQAAVALGAVEEQLLRLVVRGHQRQPPLPVDAGLHPAPGPRAARPRASRSELTR